jgi:hypothetical protein
MFGARVCSLRFDFYSEIVSSVVVFRYTGSRLGAGRSAKLGVAESRRKNDAARVPIGKKKFFTKQRCVASFSQHVLLLQFQQECRPQQGQIKYVKKSVNRVFF